MNENEQKCSLRAQELGDTALLTQSACLNLLKTVCLQHSSQNIYVAWVASSPTRSPHDSCAL